MDWGCTTIPQAPSCVCLGIQVHTFSMRNVPCLIQRPGQGSNRPKRGQSHSRLTRPVTGQGEENVSFHLLENTAFCHQRENLL